MAQQVDDVTVWNALEARNLDMPRQQVGRHAKPSTSCQTDVQRERESVQTTLGWRVWVVSIAITISLIGMYVQRIAVSWYIWESTNSTIWLAALAIADLLPTLVLGIPAGVLIDRVKPTTTVWASHVASSLQGLMLFVVSADRSFGPPVCSLLRGISWRVQCLLPAVQISYIALLTPRCCYARAVALNSLAGNAALFVGPVLGCKLMSSMGINAAFAGNAASYIPIIFTVMVAQPNKSCLVLTNESVGMLRQASDGFRFAMRNGEVRNLLLSFAALAVTARAVITFAPSIAASTLHGDIEVLSALTATLAFGAVTGGLCMTKWGLWPVRAMLIVTLGGGGSFIVGVRIDYRDISCACWIHVPWLHAVSEQHSGYKRDPADNAASMPRSRNSLYNIIFKGGPAAGAAAFGALTQFVDVRGANVLVALTLVFMMIWILRRLNDGGTERSAGP